MSLVAPPLPIPLNIRHAYACGDWSGYNLIMNVFMSLVASTLQRRRHVRFDMLSNPIRSSNTLSLGSEKPNCDITVRFRVSCSSSSYNIFKQIFNYYIITKCHRSYTTFNAVEL